MIQNTSVSALAILLVTAIPGLSDTKIVTSYITDGQTVTTTIYAKGQRVRYDYGKGLILLRQCDLKRMVQLDEQGKTYLSLPEEPSRPGSSPKAQVTDTGESKEMFGYSARHLTMTKATEGKKERTDTDGWYIDLKDMAVCSGQESGSESHGYPSGYTITTYGENGKPVSKVTMSVTAVVTDPLDAALFEIPAGYKDTGIQVVAAKPAGAVRIGTIPMQNQFSSQVQGAGPYNQLFAALRDAKLDVIPLGEGTQEGVEQKARDKQCDYILYTELASLEKPATGKLGGMLKKAGSVSHVTNGEAIEAHVNYRLVPVSGGSPVLASSAIGRMGGSINWKNTAILASNLLPMTMAVKFVGGSGALNPAMMNSLLSGNSAGASMSSVDPMMGGISMFLRAANLGPGSEGNASEAHAYAAAALSAALDVEAKAIVSQLKTSAR
jgi:hypothetical protein